jgi:hypothetical protein
MRCRVSLTSFAVSRFVISCCLSSIKTPGFSAKECNGDVSPTISEHTVGNEEISEHGDYRDITSPQMCGTRMYSAHSARVAFH